MEYISSVVKNLIAREYRFLGLSDGGDTISEKTAFGVFVKAAPPVLYVANIINGDKISAAAFEAHSENFISKIRQNKENMNCIFTVDINIIAKETVDGDTLSFINSKDYDVTEKNHSIWWAVSLSEKKVINGKNMPDDLDGLLPLLKKSFGKSVNMSIAEMEKEEAMREKSLIKTEKATATYIIIAITAIAFVFTKIFGGEELWAYILGNDHDRIVLYGEYYRLISCIFIHGGLAHICYNLLSLYIFGTRSEKYLGHINFMILYFGAGLCGSIFSFLFTDGLSVGASGAVYGAVGAVFALSYIYKKSVGGMSNYFMLLFVVAGLGMGFVDKTVDNFAHIGGFLFGLIFTAIYLKISSKIKEG